MTDFSALCKFNLTNRHKIPLCFYRRSKKLNLEFFRMTLQGVRGPRNRLTHICSKINRKTKKLSNTEMDNKLRSQCPHCGKFMHSMNSDGNGMATCNRCHSRVKSENYLSNNSDGECYVFLRNTSF